MLAFGLFPAQDILSDGELAQLLESVRERGGGPPSIPQGVSSWCLRTAPDGSDSVLCAINTGGRRPATVTLAPWQEVWLARDADG